MALGKSYIHSAGEKTLKDDGASDATMKNMGFMHHTNPLWTNNMKTKQNKEEQSSVHILWGIL